MKKYYIKPIVEAEQVQSMMLMQIGSPGDPLHNSGSGTGDIIVPGGGELVGG